MTDERIKEELNNMVSAYMRNPCGEKIGDILLQAVRAAERLGKIEVLETLKRKSVDYDMAESVISDIESMLSELKAGR